MTEVRSLHPSDACPCGRKVAARTLSFEKCCGQYLDFFETQPAPDPESLMRSRYCAFVLERERYLLDTWSPDQRPQSVEFEAQAQWLGLEIKSKKTLDADHAVVEFVARYRLNGRATRLHERSVFERKRNRWFYHSAQEDK
ncbi:YchJ family protein [Zwartia vadi]|uniref:YchJ family protein n=1 Tax=Zwartia vadi TaxID=3058168 RepID=UPI0025B3A6F5|nr:YchJ family metal-binding protein [Zwartia vadi]MDN3988717.1 YchJ family metal-binding protein [Zwartia vadi]